MEPHPPPYPYGLAPPPGAPDQGNDRYGNGPPQPGAPRNDREGGHHSLEKPAPGAQQWNQAAAGAQAPVPADLRAHVAHPATPIAVPCQQQQPGAANQVGDPKSDADYYVAERCLLLRLGESIIGRTYVSPRDCKAGLLRNTVCATNLRLIMNTHFRFLCLAKNDYHNSVFYECIYSASVGQSKDWRPLVYPLISAIVGLLMIVVGYGVGGWLRPLGGLGISFFLGSGGFSLSYLIVEMLSTGSTITIEHKTFPGQSQSTVPVNATRFIHARLETADCMELMETILSHRGTHLLSSIGALQ